MAPATQWPIWMASGSGTAAALRGQLCVQLSGLVMLTGPGLTRLRFAPAGLGRLQLAVGQLRGLGGLGGQGSQLVLNFAGDNTAVLQEMFVVGQGDQELFQYGRIAEGHFQQ